MGTGGRGSSTDKQESAGKAPTNAAALSFQVVSDFSSFDQYHIASQDKENAGIERAAISKMYEGGSGKERL